MLTSVDVRQKFIDYFVDKGHSAQKSASLVPEDKTVLLTIAGMLPFKPYFLGKKVPPFNRATSVQKCIRTNDLENVGRTPRHQTFFEMLGNFSFGDYFKKDAIIYAWDLLTNHYKLPKDKLYVSVYKEDDEAIALWSEFTDVDKTQIVRLDKDNNFWESGPTGPCGPCSEIYYDYGVEYGCGNPDCAPGCDCNRFVEIWNLVFMEFNKNEKGELSPLPKKNIDTGMGLERICSVLQNVKSNFETDLFTPITKELLKLAKAESKVSLYVVADHARAVTFMIADGIYPSNEGRGYILKKIIRRAIRHGKILGINEAFLCKICLLVIDNYKIFYNELWENRALIEEIVNTEETNFSKTLDFGLSLLEEIITDKKQISGEDAFKLFDTFGFPLELTMEIAEEKKVSVDTQRFEGLMEEQRTRARGNAVFYKDGESKPKGGEAIVAKNEQERIEMARHHSVTHLLQAALRQVLGTHVTQAGSLVSTDRLRFDFTHPKALTTQQLQEVEHIVNEKIMANLEVAICEKTYDEAIQEGAMALFTEKYENLVRVVKMGSFSTELCGGTHVNRTGDIGLFKIVSEAAISNGIRRIEAVAGSYALALINHKLEIIDSITLDYQISSENVLDKFTQLRKENSDLKKEKTSLLSSILLVQLKTDFDAHKIMINNIPIIIKSMENVIFPDNPKDVLDKLPESTVEFVALIINNTTENKISIIIKASNKLITHYKISAGELLKETAKILEGNGGGRPDYAQGGGKNASQIPQALDFLKKTLEERLK